MFKKKPKTGTKEYLRNVTLYKYHIDNGRLEIFPRCILYEQVGIRPKELFARGVTKTIGIDNYATVENKPGKVLARCFESTAMFWLQYRDDKEAKRIIDRYISELIDRNIEDIIRMADDAQNVHDVMKRAFEGSIPETNFSKTDLEKAANNYIYHAESETDMSANTSKLYTKGFVESSISVLDTLKSVRDTGYESMNRLKLEGLDITTTKEKLAELDKKIDTLETDIKNFMAQYNISITD